MSWLNRRFEERSLHRFGADLRSQYWRQNRNTQTVDRIEFMSTIRGAGVVLTRQKRPASTNEIPQRVAESWSVSNQFAGSFGF